MPLYKIIEFGLVATEWLAFIAGIMYWRKLKDTYWKWFVFYLGVIGIAELIGLSLLYWLKHAVSSRAFYNYFVIPLEFLFFSWLYYQYFKPGVKKYWPLSGAAIYIFSWLLTLVFFSTIDFWSIPLSYMAGIIVLLSLTIIFFFSLITGNEILAFKQNMMFWVSLGLLIFYLVSSPFFGLRDLLYTRHRNIFWIYYYLQFGVNYLMYIFFTIAIVWGKPH